MKNREKFPLETYTLEQGQKKEKVRFRSGHLLVRFREGILDTRPEWPLRSEEARRRARERVKQKLMEVEDLAKLDFTILSPPGFRTVFLRIDSKVNTLGLVHALKKKDRVFDGVGIDAVMKPGGEPGYAFVSGNPKEQWGLEYIDMFAAWERQTGEIDGGEPVLIGLLDSGLPIDPGLDPSDLAQGTRLTGKLTHEDLDGSRFLAGRNSFYEEGESKAYWPMESSSSYHGTMMAGIIAAGENNGIGMAGVNWKSDVYCCTVMSSAVGEDGEKPLATHGTTLVGVQDAALYAACVGKKLVLNLSLRFPIDPDFDLTDLVFLTEDMFGLFEAIELADAVVALAAGNDYTAHPVPGAPPPDADPDEYYLEYPALTVAKSPSILPRFLITGATGQDGEIWWNSGRGEDDMVFAPGDNIMATTLRSVIYDEVDGTSPATAHVSALAALLWREDSSRSAAEIVRCIQSTAREPSPGAGYRIIDAGAAFRAMRNESELLTPATLRFEEAAPGIHYARSIQIGIHTCGTATMSVKTTPAGCFGISDGSFVHEPGAIPFALTVSHCATEADPDEITGTVEVEWLEQERVWSIGIQAFRS